MYVVLPYTSWAPPCCRFIAFTELHMFASLFSSFNCTIVVEGLKSPRCINASIISMLDMPKVGLDVGAQSRLNSLHWTTNGMSTGMDPLRWLPRRWLGEGSKAIHDLSKAAQKGVRHSSSQPLDLSRSMATHMFSMLSVPFARAQNTSSFS